MNSTREYLRNVMRTKKMEPRRVERRLLRKDHQDLAIAKVVPLRVFFNNCVIMYSNYVCNWELTGAVKGLSK